MIATEYCKNVFDGTHDSPKFLDNGYLLVTSKNIANRELDLTDANFISEEDYNKINERSKVHQWDIFFSMIGTVGNVFLQTEKEVNYAIKNMGVFSCENEDKAKWLYYYLQSPYFKKLMNSLLSGAVQKFVPLGFLRSIDIPKYDDNKKAIVKFLSSLDDKIALNNRINAKLEQMAKRLYDYWFVQFDFPVSCHSELVSESHSDEMLNQVQHDECAKPYKSTGGKMVWNETLKREIPDGWEVGNLYDIAEYVNGLACQNYRPKESEKSLPVIKIREMNEGITADTEKVSASIPGKYRIYAGDILFSWSASLEIKIWTGETGGLNQHIFKVIPKGYFSKGYVYQQLSAYLVNFQKMAESRKTTMGHITSDHIKQSRILIPPKEIISAFTKKTLSIFNYQLSIEKETQKLTALRDRLLPLLMNGQVVVE